ncbi:MAG TPA: ribosomal protein S18-alanine N-acetyltransferase [Haloplasmataceae bacterium]
MNDKYIIKRITDENDFDEILLIEEKAFFEPYTKEIFLYDFNYHPYSEYYKLILDEKIIGYCGLWVIEENAQITTIAISPEYQSKGYGSILLEFIINYLKERNCQNVTLEVRVSNEKAIKFYEKFQFQKITLRKHYYENGEDAYLMILVFSAQYN